MPGKSEEIHIQPADVYGNMGRALRGIHHHDGPLFMGNPCDLPDRVHPPEHIGNLGNRRQSGARGERAADPLLRQPPVRAAFQEFQNGSCSGSNHLPGQKIAVVFLLIAVITGILHKTGVFYVPGLTALTLCVAMCAEGSDMLKGTGKKKNTSRRVAAILVLAFGLLNLVVGGFEIYDYVIRL